MSVEFFKVDTFDRMINHLFSHGINEFQNQVPLGYFWARGTKWGCVTKNKCHVLVIVTRIFPNWLRDPKWCCYSSYKSVIRLLSSKAAKNHENKTCHIFWKI